ncbi:MAG: hypothetical protein RL095_3491 [Verrucomicrobiota bacterium]|jgi:hypothetical protein
MLKRPTKIALALVALLALVIFVVKLKKDSYDQNGYYQGLSINAVRIQSEGATSRGVFNSPIAIQGRTFEVREHLDGSIGIFAWQPEPVLIHKVPSMPVTIQYQGETFTFEET